MAIIEKGTYVWNENIETSGDYSINVNFKEEPTTTATMYMGDKAVSKMYLGDKEVKKAYLGDKLVYEAKSPTSTGETWVLNKSPLFSDLSQGNVTRFTATVDFTSNSQSFISIRVIANSSLLSQNLVYNDATHGVIIYNGDNGSLANEAYLTLTFANTPTDSNLLAFLQKYGTKQGEPSTTTYTLTFNQDDTSTGYAITRDGEYVHSPCTAKSGDVFVFEAIKMTNTINGVSYNSSVLTGIMTFSEDVTIVGSGGPQIVLISGQSFSITFK